MLTCEKRMALPPINESNIIAKYNEFGNVYSVAKFFRCRTKTISKILYSRNINVYAKRRTARIHHLNETFFDSNSDESLYWAGFIAADGHIKHNKSYYIAIHLAEKDTEHLVKFKQALQTTAPIHRIFIENSKRNQKYKDTYNVMIHINSKKLVRSLDRFNLVLDDKTHDLKFPGVILSLPNINVFCRGYFDGDGGFGRSKDGQLYFSIRGTEKFLESFHKILIEYVGVKTINKKI